MKNLTTLLLTTIFIATFGFGQPTMTIATTLEITPEVTTLAGSGSYGSEDEELPAICCSVIALVGVSLATKK